MRSRCRCSMCPAIHITSRSWLRSSSTHVPSDPPLGVVRFAFSRKLQHVLRHCVGTSQRYFLFAKNKTIRAIARGASNRRATLRPGVNRWMVGRFLRKRRGPDMREVMCRGRPRRESRALAPHVSRDSLNLCCSRSGATQSAGLACATFPIHFSVCFRSACTTRRTTAPSTWRAKLPAGSEQRESGAPPLPTAQRDFSRAHR